MNTLLNLSDYWISNIHPMPQERVAILMIGSSCSASKMAILDSDGSVIYSEAFDFAQDDFDWSPNHNNLFLGRYNPNGIYIYELNESGSYTKTILQGSLDSENPHANKFMDPRIFYTKNGSAEQQADILNKYSFDRLAVSGTTIQGHLSAGFYQENFILNWESSLGSQYQIQSSTNLIDWTPVGQRLTGTGYSMTWANHITNSQAFYRVVED